MVDGHTKINLSVATHASTDAEPYLLTSNVESELVPWSHFLGVVETSRAGVAEGVIMKIGGRRTRSVFERYAIVSQSDIAEAIGRLEIRDGHSHGHSEPKQEQPTEDSTN